jgi:hypothetical protein
MATDTELLEDLDRKVETEEDEPEVAHIGRREDITRAYVTGEPITALCGAVFVPTRDPSRYPVCEACEQMMARLRSGRGGSN